MTDDLTELVFRTLTAMSKSLERLDEQMTGLEHRLERLDDVRVAQFQTGYRFKDAARIFGCSCQQFYKLVERGWIRTYTIEPGPSIKVVTLAQILEAREHILQEDRESRLHPWHQHKGKLPPGLEQLVKLQSGWDLKVQRATAVRRGYR